MIRLDATTRKIQVVLAGAITTNQLPVTVCYADKTASSYPGSTTATVINTNSTTAVDIVAAPAASTIRTIDYLSVFNADTAAATVTIRYNDNATLYTIVKVTLSVGDTLSYTHANGWRVIDANGNTKTASGLPVPSGTSGGIPYYSATNVISSSALLTLNGILCGGGAGATPYATAAMTDGQLLVGQTSAAPLPKTISGDLSLTAAGVASVLTYGTWHSINNTSLNNSTTPNTKFDLQAGVVVLRNGSNQTVVQYAPSIITNDVSVAGSTANGRDQAGVFSASSWIHFYWIWNGTTLASLSSTVAPTTGPTLPSGYTHWAYCCAVRFDGSSHLLKVRVRGDWVFQEARSVPLNNGAATTETAVDISAFLPPNALEWQMETIQTETTNGSGVFDVSSTFRVVSGSNFWNSSITMNGLGISASEISPPAVMRAPNVGQNFYYLNTNTTGSVVFTVVFHGFRIPN
jgi:hypothetical protein